MGSLFTSSHGNAPIKKQYFGLITKSMKIAYLQNSSSEDNQAIALLKKNFTQTIASKRIKHVDKDFYFISWSEYLELYLTQLRAKNVEWAKDLYEDILKKPFANELQYQSDFFYEEFRIMTCARKIKESIYNKQLDENNDRMILNNSGSFQEITDETLKTMKLPISNSLSISNNFMGSFASFGTSSINSDDDLNDNEGDYKKTKRKIQEYMKVFKKHIFNVDHPIYEVVKKFAIYFERDINTVIAKITAEKGSDVYKELLHNETDKLIDQLKAFIVELQIVVKLFYSQSISYFFFQEEKDEFINLMSSLVFKSGNIYEKMFEVFKLKFEEQICTLRTKMEMYTNLQPQDVGVKAQFCLNNITEEYQKSLLSNVSQEALMKQNEKKEENTNEDEFDIIDGDDDMRNKEIDLDKKNEYNTNNNNNNNNGNSNAPIANLDENGDPIINPTLLKKEDEIRTELKVSSESSKLIEVASSLKRINPSLFTGDTISTPFNDAIVLIKTLAHYQVPLEKLTIIASVSAEITESVNKFWKKMQNIIRPSLLKIDADQLMTIYIYIILHTNMSDILVHSAFVRYFITQATKSSMMGYYFSTLEGTLDFLLSIEGKEDFLSEGKKKEVLDKQDEGEIEEEINVNEEGFNPHDIEPNILG